jgi:hypothetical protein
MQIYRGAYDFIFLGMDLGEYLLYIDIFFNNYLLSTFQNGQETNDQSQVGITN